MKKLSGVIKKETLILIRDIPALLFLFIMPVILLIVISITEDRVSKQNRLTILLIGPDSSEIKQEIANVLKESKFFTVENITATDSQTVLSAKKEIARGKYQAGIIVPADAMETMSQRAEKLVALYTINPNSGDTLNCDIQAASISILFDPAIKESIKYSLMNGLNGIFSGIEVKMMMRKYVAWLEKDIERQFKTKMDSLKKKEFAVNLPSIPMMAEINSQIKESMNSFTSQEMKLDIPEFPQQSQNLIKLSEEYTFYEQGDTVIKPTVTQNRVPGFTLFAMFFILIPLTGSIITERNEGTFGRLRTLPVTYFTLLSGKIIVYTLVCLVQGFFMLGIGVYVLPMFFDIPALVIGSHYLSILITTIMSALAAIGFGILVGTWATSHAQASSFGSLLVVILGLLGGVFVPVYLMPDIIKNISMISPLRWGIDSFLDLFVRNTGMSSVFPNIIKLFLFFLLSLTVSIHNYSRRK
jgi:ABC-2 type transport system permease protein